MAKPQEGQPADWAIAASKQVLNAFTEEGNEGVLLVLVGWCILYLTLCNDMSTIFNDPACSDLSPHHREGKPLHIVPKALPLHLLM
jgi:hypothetical protein